MHVANATDFSVEFADIKIACDICCIRYVATRLWTPTIPNKKKKKNDRNEVVVLSSYE